MHFKDKVAIVTGASKGVGKQVALDLAKRGSTIILIARSKKALHETLQEVKEFSPKSVAIVCDVTDNKKIKLVVKKIIELFKKVDILINNAGFGLHQSFLDASVEDFRAQMETNYFGTLYFAKAVAPYMKERRFGYIINISSVAGKAAFPNVSGYCASKHAVVGLSEGMHFDLNPFNVHVGVVCPGAISDTSFFNHESWKSFHHEDRHKHMVTPEQVSRKIIVAMQKKKFQTYITLRNKVIVAGKNIVPEQFMKQVNKLPKD